MAENTRNPRIAFYGGSFDPLHNGHLKIAQELTEFFELDEFVFIPAFHAPHKKDKKPTSAFHRYAMLCLATNDETKIRVSKMELDLPEKPYTIETLTKLKTDFPDRKIFFVMGADSWAEITTWREWEKILTSVNIIVVTRPPIEIDFSHVTTEIKAKIVDVRGKIKFESESDDKIYITDAVSLKISATEIRNKVREKNDDWQTEVPGEIVKYIKKYALYI